VGTALTMLVVAVLAAGGATLVVHTRRAAQARAAAVRDAAQRLGWGFREDVAFKEIPDLDRFELFRTGHSKKLRNLLTSPPGTPGATRAVVFDYTYAVSSGKTQQTHRQTVFYATSDALRLPSFSLRPEHFMHRVAGVFGYQDIDLEGRPEFSRMFLLRGEDEARVREVFTDDVAAFLEHRPRTCAAGAGRELLFWRPGRLARPDELEALIREGTELAARLGAGRQRA
jgi:hypothetical protein